MTRSTSTSRPWLPYVAPMVLFLILTACEGLLPKSDDAAVSRWYPIAYGIKVALVGLALWLGRSAWNDLRPLPKGGPLVLAVALGLLVTLLWIGLDGLYPPLSFGGGRTGFDPTTVPEAGRIPFLIVRMLGLVVLVPLFEELFWRSFVIRWIVRHEFQQVPMGRVTPLAALVTSLLFALAHPEWLPAFITGLAWAWLLLKTRSVAACWISHAVANLALGIYVLATGAWRFW